MILKGYRQGFACNSSSEHTIALLSKLERHSPIEINDLEDNETSLCFGWENFVLANADAKTRYAAAHLYENLTKLFPPDVAALIVKDWTGRNDLDFQDAGVDHQSRILIPCRFDRDHLNQEFFNDLLTYLRQRDVIVFGGNDNDGVDEAIRNAACKKIPTDLIEGCTKAWVARKDGAWWTLFSTFNGNRLTFSFDANPAPLAMAAPFMVDMKVTNRCDMECEFCYQNSTRDGLHADVGRVNGLIYELKNLKVFELAIGGGEPTLHPGFQQILDTCKSCHIAASFTTRQLGWLSNPTVAHKIMTAASSFSYSVRSHAEVMSLYTALVRGGFYDCDLDEWRLEREGKGQFARPHVQVVLGVTYVGEIEEIVNACNMTRIPLIVLGYKKVGRGSTYKYVDDAKGWLKAVSKANVRVGIDAVAAKQYARELTRLHFPRYLLDVDEGVNSCYVDAVSWTVAPSSYAPEKERIALPERTDFKDAYAALQASMKKKTMTKRKK